jgi:hypothetical protein
VAFGDSLPEGAVTTVDASRRFPHLLTARLVGIPHWVVNAGIGGHRLLGDDVGERGLARFDRDVLAVPGAGHLVAHFGLNDLGLPGVLGFDTVTAEQLIDGLTELGRPRPIRLASGTRGNGRALRRLRHARLTGRAAHPSRGQRVDSPRHAFDP